MSNPKPAPAPAPVEPDADVYGTVHVDIRVPEGIVVEVYVNGRPLVTDMAFHPVPS